jgi:hypothetical protein
MLHPYAPVVSATVALREIRASGWLDRPRVSGISWYGLSSMGKSRCHWSLAGKRRSALASSSLVSRCNAESGESAQVSSWQSSCCGCRCRTWSIAQFVAIRCAQALNEDYGSEAGFGLDKSARRIFLARPDWKTCRGRGRYASRDWPAGFRRRYCHYFSNLEFVPAQPPLHHAFT